MSRLKKFFGSWTGLFVLIFLFIFFIGQIFVIPSNSMNPTLKIGDRILALKFYYGLPIPRLPVINQRILPDFFNNGHLIPMSGPKRNDIVVFQIPIKDRLMFVKRCVALAGDEILYTEKDTYFKFNSNFDNLLKDIDMNNTVLINGEVWFKNPYKEAHYTMEKYSAFSKMKNILLSGKINIDKEYDTYLDMEPIFIDKLDLPVFHVKDKKYNAFYKKVKPNSYYMIGDNRNNSWDSRFWGSVDYKYIEGKMFMVLFSTELRNYKQVYEGYKENTVEHKLLEKVCSKKNIKSKECKEQWNNNEKGKIRKDRIFLFLK